MITIQQLQTLIADTLFSGDVTIAGLIMFSCVLGLVFALCKGDYHVGLLITIPLALIFSLMGVLSSDLTILLIIIAVLALVLTAKRTIGE